MAPDPKADLRDWIRPRFDDTAISVTFASADDIDIANYDVGPSYPSIAIVSSDWVTERGGTTGATGYSPTGGAHQHGYYAVLVDCWGGTRETDVYATEGSDPDIVANELGQELHRVARGGAAAKPTGYQWSFSTIEGDANDTEAEPTAYRRQVTVRLGYHYTP